MITIERLTEATLDAGAAIAAFSPDPWTRDNLQYALNDPRRLTLLARVGSEPAGFACCQVVAEGADLEQVAVLPQYRRRGVARALIAQVMAQAQARGAAHLLLEVRASNTGAQALYQGMGFKTLARRPGMYQKPTEDGFLMALSLDN